jgi:hypothetical protein
MRWATRAGIHIDRASSAWLLRRFVDPDAEFVFVDAPEAPGLDVVLRGLSMTSDDDTVLALAEPVFDGLYEYYRRSLILGTDTPT